MNILFVTGDFAKDKRNTAMGGMALAVYKSALGMKQLGHSVRILTLDKEDRRWTYKGLKVISIQAKYGTDENTILSSLYQIIKRESKIERTIKKLNRAECIDIIQYTGWYGIGLLHFSKIPAIMRVSSYTKVQLVHNYDGWKKRLLEIVEYLAAIRMNYIFAPSRIMAKGLEFDIKKKVGIIETPFLKENIEWNDCILKTKLKDKKYILFFGRMSVDKGIFVIKDIIYKVLSKDSDIYFVFAGFSSVNALGVRIENELKDAAKEYGHRVLFLGPLSKDKLFPVINNAEVVLMPSLADNFPNSCAEAMSLGKIVIGTEGSSLEQFIKNKHNGFLVEIGNANSLCDCVESVLEMDDKEKKIICEQAKKRIEKLSLERYSENMGKLYEKIIESDKHK